MEPKTTKTTNHSQEDHEGTILLTADEVIDQMTLDEIAGALERADDALPGHAYAVPVPNSDKWRSQLDGLELAARELEYPTLWAVFSGRLRYDNGEYVRYVSLGASEDWFLLEPDEFLEWVKPDELKTLLNRAAEDYPGWKCAVSVPDTKEWRDLLMEATGIVLDPDDSLELVITGTEE